MQNSVAADVSRRKHLKLARTNVRGYEVLKEPQGWRVPPKCCLLDWLRAAGCHREETRRVST